MINLLNLTSCNGDKDKLFTSLSHKRTGIDFRNWIKESETFNVLDYGYLYNGAGVAVGDINNDGLPDIYFSAVIWRKANCISTKAISGLKI